MIKSCVVLDGKIINVGEWDYQIGPIMVTPAEVDGEGNVITPAVYEDAPRNPLPEGATFEERDFEYDPDRGWYESGTPAPKTPEERIAELEREKALMQAAIDDLILNGGGI